VTTSSLSSPDGREWEIGLGVWRVGIACVTPFVKGVVVAGRKERIVGAEGSFGSEGARGLRVQCWPKSCFVFDLPDSEEESESESKSEEEEEDDASESAEKEVGGRVRSSEPERMKVSM